MHLVLSQSSWEVKVTKRIRERVKTCSPKGSVKLPPRALRRCLQHQPKRGRCSLSTNERLLPCVEVQCVPDRRTFAAGPVLLNFLPGSLLFTALLFYCTNNTRYALGQARRPKRPSSHQSRQWTPWATVTTGCTEPNNQFDRPTKQREHQAMHSKRLLLLCFK